MLESGQSDRAFDPTLNKNEEFVNLSVLSTLTGFPSDMIKKELLLDENLNSDEYISITELRKAMLKYLDATFLN